MEVILREKYLLPTYFDKLHDQTYILTQCSISITEYTQKFTELKEQVGRR